MRIVTPASEAEFARYFDLRWRILRAPWEQPRGSEKDDLEESSWHFMSCTDDGVPVGAARLHLNSSAQAQIRYMAVENEWRKRGIGRALVDAMEAKARALGVDEIVLHARDDSRAFYERLGYDVVGAGPVLFDTIRHSLMRKRLR